MMKKLIKEILKEDQLSLFDNYKDTSYETCSHFTNKDDNELCKRLNSFGSFLYSDYGLGLQAIIDSKTEQMKEVLDLNQKYQLPLELLSKTGKYSDTNQRDFISEKDGVYEVGVLKSVGRVYDERGKWDYVNKLNTNWSDLAELLTELLIRGGMVQKLKDKNDLGLKTYLKSIKDKLSRVLDKYISLDEYKTFVRNTKYRSQIGEKAENDVKKILDKAEIKTLYQGGDGDFIDMIFGIDLIVNDGGGIYTIQVKSSEDQAQKSVESKRYGKVDFIVAPTDYGIIMFDHDKNVVKFDKDGNQIN